MASRSPILIAGAGLAGLAAARALPRGIFRICEAESEPGGLCRSIRRNGYTFDHTGHLLHLKGEMLAFVESLLGGNLAVIRRRARVRTHGVEIDYPFQIHLHGLPPEVREECLEGFEAASRAEIDTTNFATWCLSVFGSGITRHFMRPYNEKLLRTRLESMSADWVHYIPRPKIEDVRAGARGARVEGVGYNAEFRYPKRGGIGCLPEALVAGLPVETGAPLEAIRPSDRRALVRGEWIAYDRLISTIPLPRLVRGIEGAPADVRAAAAALESVGVLCLNLAIDGPTSDAHWMYFPEERFPFFRVGFYHNIAPSSAPPGKSALYVEWACRSRSDLPPDYLRRAIDGLVEAGILRDASRVEDCVEVWIDAAYAIPAERRARAMAAIEPYLAEAGVIPIGRYGRWAYTSMGDALQEGRAAAEKLAAR